MKTKCSVLLNWILKQEIKNILFSLAIKDINRKTRKIWKAYRSANHTFSMSISCPVIIKGDSHLLIRKYTLEYC